VGNKRKETGSVTHTKSMRISQCPTLMTRASWHIVSSDQSAVRVCVDAWSSPLICAFRFRVQKARDEKISAYAVRRNVCAMSRNLEHKVIPIPSDSS